MKTNRIPVYAILLLCLAFAAGSSSLLLAQETSEEGVTPQDEGAGRGFALFLEAGAGALAAEDIEASIRNTSTYSSSTLISFTDFVYGEATLGWQLANDKGRFEVTYNGHREDSFRMDAQGYWASLVPDSEVGFGSLPEVPWWTMTIDGGTLHSELRLPSWYAAQNDANGDGSVDLDEVVFDGTPAAITDNPAQTDMQNSLQTYDALYRRWFGNRRYGGVWSVGLRYLEYGGNIPAAFWISNDNNEYGWTDGGFQNPLIFTQETSGIGPTASLGFELKYFRDRLQLFGEGRLAFLFQTMETDSGQFFTLLQDPGGGGSSLLSLPAEVSSQFDKDVWNVTADAGVRVQILSGLFFELAYTVHSYHDTVLLPTQLTIPDVLSRIGQPVGGVFRSQDLVYEGVRSTLSFQF